MSIQVEVRVAVALWVRWYIAGVYVVARLTGLEPDWNKVQSNINRGIRVECRP